MPREALARAREAIGFSQESLAETLGVHPTTVGNWETGRSSPLAHHRRPLAEKLQISVSELAVLLDPPGSSGANTLFLSNAPSDNDLLGRDQLVRDDAEQIRIRLESSLSESASPARMELVEQQVAHHLGEHTRIGPDRALESLLPDLADVQALAARRQPVFAYRRLSTATTMLTLLIADAYMKLQRVTGARRWYGTALLAARDADDSALIALVLAQQTMLAYYYEPAQSAVALARRAQAFAADHVCDAAALAVAAEARALGKLGDVRGVREALELAGRLTEKLAARRDGQEDQYAAFRFGPGRLHLYASGAWANLGDAARARVAQDAALRAYAGDERVVIDPALVRLDQAVTEAHRGDVVGATTLALAVLAELPPTHRTGVVLTRAHDVVTVTEALPHPGGRVPDTVRELRSLTTPVTHR
ncbi:helix-turn-helix domain-containing protein [Saccharothrix lopnurensis]|uniref:Helix-turn-helix domain-containing protein n=1 Tax=Saccharothrix lopnurensis TaxID=1670621 RepID=A0ABW1P369_9PSEU